MQEDLAAARAAHSKMPGVDRRLFDALRKQEREAGRAGAALEAMATGIELIGTDSEVALDGKALAPWESRILTGCGELPCAAKEPA